MKVCLVISSLRGGGAELTAARLAAAWTRLGWRISVACLGRAGGDFRGEGFDVIELDAARGAGLRANLRRARLLRRRVRELAPDAVVSFMDTTNVLALFALAGLGLPVIVAERSVPAVKPIGRAWSVLRRILYRRAAALVVQTRSAAQYFAPALAGRTEIIPNWVAGARAREASAGSVPRVVAVGRLSEEKGYDLLIEGFALLRSQRPDAHLTIWGEGEERGRLLRLIADRGLAGSVALPGETETPLERMAEADVFVLSSRYEGFPNALCEAMSIGLPVVAFDCPGGVREIVRDGQDGLLVPAGSARGLADALLRLIDDPAERARLSARALEISQRFPEESALRAWQSLLFRVAHA